MRLALSCSDEDIAAFLGQYSHFGAPVKDLSRFASLCDKLGNPQEKLRFVHIVGTNGKGSVAEFCACALAECGYNVGKFTSPYVRSVRERIAITTPDGGFDISGVDFARLSGIVAEAAAQCGELEFSQFEILNAVAFLYYLERRVDYVVLEAGIGGTLDSTNVIPQPEVAVVTSIGLDHTKILGDTVEKIAASKCGIIKGGSAIAAAGIPAGAMAVIQARCSEVGAQLIVPDSAAAVIHGEPGLNGSHFSYKGQEYHVSMGGGYQVSNALTAIEALRCMGIAADRIAAGLERARIPARMELFPGDILLDGGHNPQAAAAVKSALEQSGYRRKTAVIGMMNTKDYHAFLEVILPCFDLVIFCDGFSEGAVPAEELQQSAPGSKVFHQPEKALEFARSNADSGLIYFGGSFYFAAEIRKLLV
ncbi:MAG: bifunctional folylpolyglutamate synthase/dihydrofolate synthase [Oscillospiraceae bacterium]